MKFIIQSIDIKTDFSRMDGKKVNPPIVVFNFRQQGAFDYNTTTEMVLKIDDPVAKEYMDAFHNGKEFEFEISIKPLC